MSCILRFWGKDFKPQKAIENAPVAADKIWLAGERRYPESTNILSLNKSSGVNFLVSTADFSELQLQIEHATSFLTAHNSWLACLSSSPGLEGAVIDFGTEIANPFSQSYSFPPALLAALASVNVTLELSVYQCDDASEDA